MGVAVQGQLVLGGVEGCAGGGRESTEGTLRKRDGKGGVRGQVEDGIAFAPIPIASRVRIHNACLLWGNTG